MLENIDKFESSSTEDSDGENTTFGICSSGLPKKRKSMCYSRSGCSASRNGREGADEEISSTSPETDEYVCPGDCSRMKTSEWVHQVCSQLSICPFTCLHFSRMLETSVHMMYTLYKELIVVGCHSERDIDM